MVSWILLHTRQSWRTRRVSISPFSLNLIGIKTGKSQESLLNAMVNKCRVPGCLTNHATEVKATVFELPKDNDHQFDWLSFLDRNDLETMKHVFVFYKHFNKHFVKKKNHRLRMICTMNPFPTLAPVSHSTTNVSEAELEQLKTKTQRKPPSARVLQPYELQIFKQMETVQNLKTSIIRV